MWCHCGLWFLVNHRGPSATWSRWSAGTCHFCPEVEPDADAGARTSECGNSPCYCHPRPRKWNWKRQLGGLIFLRTLCPVLLAGRICLCLFGTSAACMRAYNMRSNDEDECSPLQQQQIFGSQEERFPALLIGSAQRPCTNHSADFLFCCEAKQPTLAIDRQGNTDPDLRIDFRFRFTSAHVLSAKHLPSSSYFIELSQSEFLPTATIYPHFIRNPSRPEPR